MSIIDQKRQAFGNIAALRTLNEGFPALMSNSSFPSINNNANSQEFLTDLLKALVGYEKLRDIIVNVLVYDLDALELEVKKAIKKELKTLVSCGVNPSVPDFLKSTGNGVQIEVPKIDFFDIMKISPTSEEGVLIYNDTNVLPLTDSSDFNTFLYGTIQNDGTTEVWQNPTILNVKFNSSGTSSRPNNTVTFNSHVTYDSKTLTDLNNDFVDSLDLFDSRTLINDMVDVIFGSISVNLNKTRKQLETEAEIQTIIDCIVNSDDTDVIDDSFFTFTNEQVQNNQRLAGMRKNGVKIVETCGNLESTVPMVELTTLTESLTGVTSAEERRGVISDNINSMAQTSAENATNDSDIYSLELEFINDLLKKVVTSIVNLVLSPKIITIFLLNYKIIYGQDEEYADAVEFLKANKSLLANITKSIRNALIQVLLRETLKAISALVADNAIKTQTERVKATQAQLLSLVGVPQEVIRTIKGLT